MSTALQLAMFTDAELEIRHRVDVALRSEKLTGVESFVLFHLQDQEAIGIKNAVSIQTLQNIWTNTIGPEYPADRTLKKAVKTLLEDYSIPIGACRIAPNNGYYFCETAQDCEDAVRPLKNEIYSMFKRIKALSPKSDFVRLLNGQLELLKEE